MSITHWHREITTVNILEFILLDFCLCVYIQIVRHVYMDIDTYMCTYIDVDVDQYRF